MFALNTIQPTCSSAGSPASPFSTRTAMNSVGSLAYIRFQRPTHDCGLGHAGLGMRHSH